MIEKNRGFHGIVKIRKKSLDLASRIVVRITTICHK